MCEQSESSIPLQRSESRNRRLNKINVREGNLNIIIALSCNDSHLIITRACVIARVITNEGIRMWPNNVTHIPSEHA